MPLESLCKIPVSLLGLIGLSLAVGAPKAQTPKFMTLPPGYETKAGDTDSYIFGGYANFHHQIGDATATGTPRTISRVDYRLKNGRYYNAYAGTGRTWTRVTLDMTETDVVAMERTFAANRLRDLTRVFAAQVTWPTVTVGTMSTAAFGNIGFQFDKPWVYTGKDGICFEFDFAGGKMANSVAWSGRTLWPYFLDSVNSDTVNTGSVTYVPASSTCMDSSQTVRTYSYGYAGYYGDTWVGLGYEDKLAVYHATYYTAPGAPVIQLVAYNGSATGVDVGAKCNKLHLDLTTAMAMTQRSADSAGYSSLVAGDGFYLVPYYSPWGGAWLWTQGAFADSKTNALHLTQSCRFQIPTQRPKPMPRKTAFAWSSNGPALAETWTFRYYYQTLPRLEYR